MLRYLVGNYWFDGYAAGQARFNSGIHASVQMRQTRSRHARSFAAFGTTGHARDTYSGQRHYRRPPA